MAEKGVGGSGMFILESGGMTSRVFCQWLGKLTTTSFKLERLGLKIVIWLFLNVT